MRGVGENLGAMVLCLLLAACGGGGGGGGDAPALEANAGVYELSGRISAAAGSAADGDTNDPRAPYQSNDTPATAQRVPNPLVLGGYVTDAPTGVTGDRFQLGADPVDAFRTELTEGQVLRLTVGQADADLDLHLYDMQDPAEPRLVDASVGGGDTETLTVPADGDYAVLVQAAGGASSYVLSIDEVSEVTGAAAGMRLSAEFVPGEVLLRLNEGPAAAGLSDPLARLQAMGLERCAGRPGGLQRMGLAQGRKALRSLGAAMPSAMEPWLRGASSAQRRRLETLRAVAALQRRPEVAAAAPNHIHRPAFVPDDPGYAQQWPLPLINTPGAWDLATGEAVIVAVVDTGVFLDHLDLQGRLVAGYDFISDPANAADGDGIDPDPDDPGDADPVAESSWHGTHVAGIVAAATDNAQGVAGVAFGAQIMPIRVLGLDGGTDYDLLQGMRYAAGLSNDSGGLPARAADIINLSLGGPGGSALMQQEIGRIREAGVIIIASAGNAGTSRPYYPAAYDGVVSVAAVDRNGGRAWYSNYGPKVDVAAPGGKWYPEPAAGVLSTWVEAGGRARRSDYAHLYGTSMAAPHVAGVAALMKSVYPALSPADFDGLLAAGGLTRDLGAEGRDDLYGWGLIDAQQAVFAALGGSPPPALVATPSRLDFGTTATGLELHLAAVGEPPLSIVSMTADVPWIGLLPPEGGAMLDPGTYVVQVDRRGLEEGLHAGRITIVDGNGGQREVSVSLRADGIAASAGHLYVLLVDPRRAPGEAVVAQQEADPQAGVYGFRFAGVPAGAYRLLAGSDADNDGMVCDAGESCGVYPGPGTEALLSVDADRGDLAFGAGFDGAGLGSAWTGMPEEDPGLRRLP